MTRFYVRFPGDNDFISTVEAFVKAIADRVLLGDWGNITKSQVAELFNYTAPSLYRLYQTREIELSHDPREYLTIESKDVYFDEEVDAFTNFNHDGCLAVIEHDRIGFYVM